jgi:hypothetical protein
VSRLFEGLETPGSFLLHRKADQLRNDPHRIPGLLHPTGQRLCLARRYRDL